MTKTTIADAELLPLEKLRKLSRDASKGEWFTESENVDTGQGNVMTLSIFADGEKSWQDVPLFQATAEAMVIECDDDYDAPRLFDRTSFANAEFAVACVNYVRTLLTHTNPPSEERIEQVARTFETAPKDGSTLLVQNAGGFGQPALVCWYRGEWRQVDYQGTIRWDAVAIISFDSWQPVATAALEAANRPETSEVTDAMIKAGETAARETLDLKHRTHVTVRKAVRTIYAAMLAAQSEEKGS